MSRTQGFIIRAAVLSCGVLLVGWLTGGCLYPVPAGDSALRTRIERTRVCMGVPARVTVEFESGADPQPVEDAIARVFDLLAALDAQLSDYQRESELNRVNAAAGGAPVAINEPLASVLATAAQVSQASDGAFDVTVGPASLAWRAARNSGVLPSEAELARVRGLVDWRRVERDPGTLAVRLAMPGMRLDVGAIGKGFAAQRAVDQLRAEGYPRAMVALAGDIAVGEPARGAKGWRIEISPADDRGMGSTVELANQAISTSGDTEQFIEIDGRRYSHIVDPRTALGTPGGVMVSVVSSRGEWADALSTAAVVMLSRGESEVRVREMLVKFPGSRAIVERRTPDGRPVRGTVE